jgi:prolyl-tRNA editing enzyme YbaK/EbsC (Cys-tRNA(Pro) deacylase)
VNEKIIANLIGEKIIKADAIFTKEITGFTIGGIPPIGHKTPIEFIFIDNDLLMHDIIWAAAGMPHAVFSIDPKDLVRITKGKVISII